MIRTALCGFAGRMGCLIREAMAEDPDFTVVLGVEAADHPLIGQSVDSVPVSDQLAEQLSSCDIVVDFTLGERTHDLAATAAAGNIPFLSGVTALSTEQTEVLQKVAREIPLLYAPNMSLGISVAGDLIESVAGRLTNYDIEITEIHHRHKKDSPSGTALNFASILENVRGDCKRRYGRHGDSGERKPTELGIHSLRGGEVVGEHHVTFAGPGERLIISHIADHRSAFVSGVLAAARFLVNQDPGFYSIKDVLLPGK